MIKNHHSSKSVLVIGNKDCVGMERLRSISTTLNASEVHLFCKDASGLPSRHFYSSILRGDEGSPRHIEKALAVTKASLVILPVGENALATRDATRLALLQVLRKPDFSRIQVLAISQTNTAVISYEKCKLPPRSATNVQVSREELTSKKATARKTSPPPPPPQGDQRRARCLISI